MEGVRKFQKYVTWLHSDPLRPTFAFFFQLVPHVINMPAKLEVSSFDYSRDIAKVSHVTASWPPLTYFAFFSLVPLVVNCWDMDGSQNISLHVCFGAYFLLN